MPRIFRRGLRWIERALIDVLSGGSFARLPPRRTPVPPQDQQETRPERQRDAD